MFEAHELEIELKVVLRLEFLETGREYVVNERLGLLEFQEVIELFLDFILVLV